MKPIGIIELLKSKKGTLSLIVLLAATILCALHKIDGISYSAVVSVVATIYNYSQHKIDMIKEGNTNERK